MGKLKNIKHEIFAHKVVQNGGNAEKALAHIQKKKSKNVASFKAQAKNMLYNPDIKARILEIMHVVYTPEQLERDIQSIRLATKPIVYNGEITDTHPDYGVRLELLKLYMKVSKVTDDATGNQTNVQFNVAVLDPNKALEIAKEIDKLSQSITPEKSGRRN